MKITEESSFSMHNFLPFHVCNVSKLFLCNNRTPTVIDILSLAMEEKSWIFDGKFSFGIGPSSRAALSDMVLLQTFPVLYVNHEDHPSAIAGSNLS